MQSVARTAGVSIGTVSNALNGRQDQMAPETFARVMATVARVGYRPNHLARSLMTNRTATIGLVISEITNSLYPPVVKGVEASSRAAGMSVLLVSAAEEAQEREALDLMVSKRVDGVIFFSVSTLAIDNQHLDEYAAGDVPIVTINRYLDDASRIPRVYLDNLGGARLATEHLLELGHRRVAHLAGPAERFTGQQRRAGYEQAMAAYGIDAEPALIATGDYTFESGYDLARQVWQEQRPTAYFVGGDAMALGALRAFEELGLRVPDAVSIVAFGDPDCVRYASPGLTTVDLPVVQAGRLAADLLIRAIARQPVTPSTIVPTSLVVRASAAALKSG